MLVSELRSLGITDARQDEHGIVLATLPGNVADAPVVVLNSHLDTSPEASGAGVKPQVVADFDGQDLTLPGNPQQRITRQENSELADLVGMTLITTDGTTLLGADDKAGIAIIMETVATLSANPQLPHGDVRILFTCDEEIGLGVAHVDVPQLGGTVCYTLDGPGRGQIDVETFSADLATVVCRGRNIHPSIAKHRMVNSIRVIADFVASLPRDRLAPEVTESREGFIHAYDIGGSVEESSVKILLRDFDTDQLAVQAKLLGKLATEVQTKHDGSEIEIGVIKQYRNLADGLRREPRAVEFAEKAYANLGKSYERSIIRGGTDGSQLTALGLPTPNLSSGQHNPHSPREFACLEEMLESVELLLELLKIWTGS
jgi:tripeptide aminopeptidase